MTTAETKQTVTSQTASIETLCRFVVTDLAMLATLHDREPDACLLQAMRETDFPRGLGLQLVDELGRQAVDLMRHVVASLPATLDDAILDELAADYASIYLNHTIQASPLESVWIDEERLTCQDSMFQVRSWYQQYGLGVENWRIRPDDHLVWQLQFLGHLFKLDPTTDGLRKAARFMDEHLLRWLMAFAQRVSARCATAYFAAAAMLTAAYCEELRELLVELLGETRPSDAEIEQRMHPRRQVEAVPVSFIPGVGPAV